MGDVANRCEKYQGVTLVVDNKWATIVWDATGHSFQGPVGTEEEVKRLARIAIPALRELAS